LDIVKGRCGWPELHRRNPNDKPAAAFRRGRLIRRAAAERGRSLIPLVKVE
jgi:hypothetical protein